MLDLLPDRAWLWIAASFYAAAFIWTTVALLRSKQRARGTTLLLVGIGLAVQTMGLHVRGMAAGGCPLRNQFEVIQFVVWSFTVLYVIVGPAFRVSLLGYFTSGLAAAMSLTSLLIPRLDAAAGTPIFGGNPWIEVHASLALFAYGAFGTLALTSLMFLLQTFSLKRKRLRGVFGFLPSIVALETMNFRLLLTGIAVLSFSIVVGGAFYFRAPDSITASKLLIALTVWCAYLAVFFLRLRRLLVSAGLAWSCMALFGVALISLEMINSGLARHPVAPAASTSALVRASEDTEAAL